MTKEVSTNQHYSDDQKLLAADAYFVTRSSTKASAKCGVPASTIRRWKQDTVTWNKNMAVIKEKYNEKLDGTLTDILELAADKILLALKEGDQKMTPQGEMVNVPVPASDVARIAKQAFEQREALRGNDEEEVSKRPYNEDELGRAFEKAAMRGKDKGLVINNDITEQSIKTAELIKQYDKMTGEIDEQVKSSN